MPTSDHFYLMLEHDLRALAGEAPRKHEPPGGFRCQYERFRRDCFFERLEEEGRFPLSYEDRMVLVGSILFWAPEPIAPDPRAKKRRKRAAARESQILVAAARISEEVFLDPEIAGFLRAWASDLQLLADLPHLAVWQLPVETKLRNKLRKEQPKTAYSRHVITMAARVYHQVGGRVAISPGGPFARFLEVLYEALPAESACKSADTFVRLAAKLLPELKTRIHELSLPANKKKT